MILIKLEIKEGKLMMNQKKILDIQEENHYTLNGIGSFAYSDDICLVEWSRWSKIGNNDCKVMLNESGFEVNSNQYCLLLTVKKDEIFNISIVSDTLDLVVAYLYSRSIKPVFWGSFMSNDYLTLNMRNLRIQSNQFLKEIVDDKDKVNEIQLLSRG